MSSDGITDPCTHRCADGFADCLTDRRADCFTYPSADCLAHPGADSSTDRSSL